jgi:bla regulator protein BlaR1
VSDVLFRIGVTKLVLSVVLACVALIVQRRFDRPPVSHVLWALVLAVLLVPAVIEASLPDLAIPSGELTESALDPVVGALSPGSGGVVQGWLPALSGQVKAALVAAWLLGALGMLIGSLVRTVRFRRLLVAASRPAGAEVQRIASQAAAALNLREVPVVQQTGAHLSPMVWWIGGTVRVLVPDALVSGMDPVALRWVLAHEMAHVRRGDHIVRWLEWLACVVFWWNPVAWWTRRQLRAAEEFCCDALVLSRVPGSARSYGSSLLSVIDFLSTPITLRPPAFASAVDTGGRTTLIERRLRKIMTTNAILNIPGWLRVTLVIGGVGALSLGLINCGADADAVGPDPDDADMPFGQVSEARQANAADLGDFDHSALSNAACADCHDAGKDEAAVRDALVRSVLAEIEEAVSAGELSKEEAQARLRELEARVRASAMANPSEGGDLMRAREQNADGLLRATAERVRAAVEAGEISEDVAKDRLREIEQQLRRPKVAPAGVDGAGAGETDLPFGVLMEVKERTETGNASSVERRKKLEEAARRSSGN